MYRRVFFLNELLFVLKRQKVRLQCVVGISSPYKGKCVLFVDKVAVYAQDGDSVEGEDDEDTVVENEDGVEDADQAVTEKEKVRHNDKKHE